MKSGILCEICGVEDCPTRRVLNGTRRCDRCWELEWRINDSPELAQKILTERLSASPAGVDSGPENEELYQQIAQHLPMHGKGEHHSLIALRLLLNRAEDAASHPAQSAPGPDVADALEKIVNFRVHSPALAALIREQIAKLRVSPPSAAAGPGMDLSPFEGNTPGPWPSEKTGDGKAVIIGAGCSSWGTEVAEVHCDDIDKNEAEANARLIAAAPELLAEVRRLRASPVSPGDAT